ncbi:formate dehydrogenase major subunit [Pseudosporangium ferrugineum]|uniref:Formate dehydrogenase major subunit n=3 Tax=Pseudosporangium ferrugineum TaxID=439699 RepID=A0A2T0RGB2_9ACTN|nr:formate dehydrogenase major subunit [Pseudosporangium ferrugineum]
MAECHPVGFQWIMEAKARGATLIHVDPRLTRTGALADLHVPIRAGTDIALLGGLINYVLSNGLEFRDYVVAYTNAATILREDFQDTEDLDGLFSGWQDDTGSYQTDSWQYEGTGVASAAGKRQQGAKEQSHRRHATGRGHEHGSHGASLQGLHRMERDETLQHPRCVFQVLKRHYGRYTPEMVARVCGIPEDVFLQMARAITENSNRDRTTAWAYSVGWTQHTVGVQYIRAASVLQLLLGNIGRPGGGILALRGHASIQGSTDIPTLYNLLPGYLPMPHPDSHGSLDEYVADDSADTGYWGNMRSYAVSLLKAYWGDAATADNDFCFDYLPRITGDHSTYKTVQAQLDGVCKGYFLNGQNPAVGSANAKAQRLGMANLDWLVVRDFSLIESATWWKDGPEVESGEMRPEGVGTEVFFLPAAAHTEKDGSFTSTQRMLQWHHKAVDPPGDARSDLWFWFHLGRIIRAKLAGSTSDIDRPLLDLTWGYSTHGERDEPSAQEVLQEINGWTADGAFLSSYEELKDDGSTACGCWIYCGTYADGTNQAARRKPHTEQNWVAPEWGWAWPANRRLLYNRASADPEGRPWSEKKAYVWWDADAGTWTGHDVPDFQPTKAPDYRPPEGAKRQDALSGIDPFIMQADGKGWLYVPAGLTDGPLPAHYEPQESPVPNLLYGQQHNPARQMTKRGVDRYNPSGDEPGSQVFPYALTTYRLTEHHTAGGMSRWLPYLSELQPEMFCEVSPELADEAGLQHLGWATIVTARSAIEARVLVTDRMLPMRVHDRLVHHVGLPYHWGSNGISTGDGANELTHLSLDPNVHIQEAKALTCDIRPGRRPRGPERLRLVEDYRRRAGVTDQTGTAHRTTKEGGA